MRETRHCKWLTPKITTEMKSWLRIKTTIEELEAEVWQGKNKKLRGKPMLVQSERWEKFKAGTQENDEIWKFSSPGEMWKNLCGMAGIALVSGGEVVDNYERFHN
jgi:hypothetical protein